MSDYVTISKDELKREARTINFLFAIIIILYIVLSFMGLKQEIELKEKNEQIEAMTELIEILKGQ